jgi:hypoxanthine phosphoribosyltransferase
MSELRYYEHSEFLADILRIAIDLKEDTWIPDIIVGLVRGGCVPAVHLSHALKVPTLMLHISTRDGNIVDIDNNFAKLETIVKAGCNVLIVDDIIDSGKTMQILLDKLSFLPYTDNIRTACLIYNVSQPVKANYFGVTIDRNEDKRWVQFPWE